MDFDNILRNIDGSDQDIIDLMSGLTSIPAISPEFEGEGEGKRADFLRQFLEGFNEVKRLDYFGSKYPETKRSSLVAWKRGERPETFWILAHIDTVPTGDLSEWDTDPFKLKVKDGVMYGRGVEDDGQAVVAAILTVKMFVKEKLNGRSLGLLLVADEENGSKYGLKKFMDSGLFKPGDTFLVPDSGDVENNVISSMEKTIYWIKGTVTGKSAHGSSPSQGINPIPPGLDLIRDLMRLKEKFPQKNENFEEPHNTFTVTKVNVSPGGVNAIPSQLNFAFDCRLLPGVDPNEVSKEVDRIFKENQAKSNTKIQYELVIENAGDASSLETDTYKSLSRAVETVVGKPVKTLGPNGGTCASTLRAKGYDSYCWVMYEGTEHQANEHISIDYVKKTMKVMAMMIRDLCIE